MVGVVLAGCRQALPPVAPAQAADVLHAVRNAGAKVVLVNLWASWCGPCREEFPALVRVQRVYAGRGLKVVFVSWDETAAAAAEFLGTQGVASPSFLKANAQSDQDFLQALEPRLTGALPATLIYDGAGKLRMYWEGPADYAKLEQAINTVLKGTS